MPVLTTSIGTIDYTDEGSGPPVLLLHATLHDRSDFAAVQQVLARDHRVLALDWPGHGSSPLPARLAEAPELGDAAEEFVDQLNLTDLVVVGNSVGGYVACRLAITRSERIAGVVVINGSGFIEYNPVTRGFCALMGHPTVVRWTFPALVRAYLAARSDTDREIARRVIARARTADGARVAAALWRSFPGPGNDLRDRAHLITAPTLITWGSRDATSPVRWGRAVHSAIAGSTFVSLPTGHVVFASAPTEWLAHVLPFIAAAQRRYEP